MNDTNTPPDPHAGWEHIWRGGDIPPRYRSFAPPNETVVAWADTIPPGSFILDVGCGVGRHVVYLGEREFRVAGVDVSSGGIEMTQAACAERHIAFDGRTANMTSLPWPDQTFAAALSTSAIHHDRRDGIRQALQEIWRVLQPSGLLLVDFPCTDTLMYQRLRRQVAAGEIVEVEPDTFVDERPQAADSDDFLPHHYCAEADLRDLLSAFEIIRLWADLRPHVSAEESGMIGKWVVWARKPI